MTNDYWKLRSKMLELYLKAILLSNQNKSLRVLRVHLDADLDDWHIQINDDLPSGDLILSIQAQKKS